MKNKDKLSLSSISIDGKGIYETDRKKVIISIFKIDISEAEVAYGSISNRPILQSFIGLILFLVGAYFGLFKMLELLRDLYFCPGSYPGDSVYGLKGFAFITLYVPLGICLFFSGIRRRFYFHLLLKKGRRKLVFQTPVSANEVLAFAEKANLRFGYKIKTPPIGTFPTGIR